MKKILKAIIFIILIFSLASAVFLFINRDQVLSAYSQYRIEKNIEKNKANISFEELLNQPFYRRRAEKKMTPDLSYRQEIRMEINRPRTYTGLAPDKAGVCLTFDDKSIGEWTSARPILKKYGGKACFYVSNIEDLSLADIILLQLLEKDGNEIGSHSFSHASAMDLGIGDYITNEIEPSVRALEGYGLTIDSFSYPFGDSTAESDHRLMDYFRSLRKTRYTRPGIAMVDLNSVYYPINTTTPILNAVGIDRTYNNPINSIKASLERARRNGEIIVLYSHRICTDDPQGISHEALKEILAYASSLGLEFYCPAELAGNTSWTRNKLYPTIIEIDINEGDSFNLDAYLESLNFPSFLDLDHSFSNTKSLDPGTYYVDVSMTDHDLIKDAFSIKINILP